MPTNGMRANLVGAAVGRSQGGRGDQASNCMPSWNATHTARMVAKPSAMF